MLAAEALSHLTELSPQQAEHWIAAVLAQSRALRQHDELLYPVSGDAIAMRTAAQFHTAWRGWLDAADLLMKRVRLLKSAAGHIAGVHDLEYEIARVSGLLSISPAEMLAREDSARRGESKSIEEVRRELRAAHRG